jgi:CheY-like chemotaxis protein
VQDSCYDVVLLDLGLPGQDGFKVAERVLGDRSGDTPLVIAVTGHGQPEYLQRAKEVGIDHYLLKPVEPQRLKAILEQLRTSPRLFSPGGAAEEISVADVLVGECRSMRAAIQLLALKCRTVGPGLQASTRAIGESKRLIRAARMVCDAEPLPIRRALHRSALRPSHFSTCP